MGRLELRAIPSPDDVDQRDEPLRRACGFAHDSRPLSVRPELHPEHIDPTAQPAATRRLVQRSRQPDRLQPTAKSAQRTIRSAEVALRTAPVPACCAPAVLIWKFVSNGARRLDRRAPVFFPALTT